MAQTDEKDQAKTSLKSTISQQGRHSSSCVGPEAKERHGRPLPYPLPLRESQIRVTPGTSSSPATRILAVTWLTYSSTPMAISANSSGSKADATLLSTAWRTPKARIHRLASMEKSEAQCGE